MTFKRGDTVTVFNSNLKGEPFIEGKATILGRGMTPQQFRVRMEDGGEYMRFVYPGEAQTSPQQFLAKLVEEHRRGGW